jgi:Protein of unknown function (DUF4197)
MKKIFLSLSIFISLLSLSACVANDDWMNAAQTVLGQTSTNVAGTNLTTDQIDLGLREALRVGTETVVTQLGRQGGFSLDPQIHIPLPQTLATAHSALSKIGMGGLTADLEKRMNQAAELAVPEAQSLFISAIKQMTIADARTILSGQSDAATQYLRRTMGPSLGVKIQPIITSTLTQAGAVQAYDRVMGQYASLPFISNVKTDMNSYVTEKALDGIFYYVAQEEAQIRANPAKRTTEILRTVFGSL